MTERHLDLLQKHRELQKAFDDTLEMNRKLGSENWKLEKENEKLKQQIQLYKEMLNRNPCVRIPDWHCSDCLEENTKLKQANKRAKVLLKATFDLLQKQKESHYVLNLLENTVFYDNAECDGYCLFDDIENFLNSES